MRTIILSLILLSACGDNLEPGPDGGLAAIDASGDAYAVSDVQTAPDGGTCDPTASKICPDAGGPAIVRCDGATALECSPTLDAPCACGAITCEPGQLTCIPSGACYCSL